MTIPANLTHAEVGAFLVAVGTHMVDRDVCADAVLDLETLKHEGYVANLIDAMREAHWGDLLDYERCVEILTNLTLEEAISFVNLP